MPASYEASGRWNRRNFYFKPVLRGTVLGESQFIIRLSHSYVPLVRSRGNCIPAQSFLQETVVPLHRTFFLLKAHMRTKARGQTHASQLMKSRCTRPARRTRRRLCCRGKIPFNGGLRARARCRGSVREILPKIKVCLYFPCIHCHSCHIPASPLRRSSMHFQGEMHIYISKSSRMYLELEL